jgi:hypothetical protein
VAAKAALTIRFGQKSPKTAKDFRMDKLLTLSFGLVAAAALAQNPTPVGYDAQENLNTAGMAGNMTVMRGFDNRYEGMRGSPYLLPYWCNADVQLASGKTQPDVPVKLDVYSDWLVMRRQRGDSAVVDPAQVKGFVLKDATAGRDRTFVKTAVKTDNGAVRNEFMEVIHEGKTALLVRYDRRILKANYQGGYNADRRYDELLPEESHYLRKPDGTLAKLKLNRKAVLEHLGDTPELRKIIEDLKLDLRKEADVARLLEKSYEL